MTEELARSHPADFEEFGYRTMLECNDVERATKICGLHLQACEDELQPELRRRNSEIAEVKHQAGALYGNLYDRPDPVNDPQMLSHGLKARILLFFAVIAAIACLVGNMTTFYLLGFALFLTTFSGAGLTALPLVVGHLAYEWIISANRWLQVLVVLVAAALTGAGILMVGQARRNMVDRAVSTTSANSYVDDADTAKNQRVQEQKPDDDSESKIHRTLGEGMLLIMIAADLALGFLVGLLVRMYTDDDFTTWRKLKELAELLIALEERVSELVALPEMAKKRCLAGILRAQNARSRRRPSYHRALTIPLIAVLCFAVPCRAQTVDRYEGILVDTSASISRGGKTNELFQEYLVAARKLLLTEPPHSRLWISSISTDSFGGAHEILKGWTPDARGVFTDDLSRARRELASSFERKSSGMSPLASGTDIFGGLWRLKALFESEPNATHAATKEIWIFSDMMNETKDFPMPELIELGPQEMLEKATTAGLMIPLKGYKVHVCGASMAGLTPKGWGTAKDFWANYFAATGAELISYSADIDVER